MNKLATVILVVACMFLLCACDAKNQAEPVVFSFSGEGEQFSVYNGVVILYDDREVFEGGDLKVTQPEMFADVTFYSCTFYTVKDGERRTILSTSVADMTGGTLNLNGDLGRIAGEHCLSGGKIENVDTFKDNLWMELTVADKNGGMNIYPLHLNLTEIAANADP